MLQLKLPIIAKLSSNQKKGHWSNYEKERETSIAFGFCTAKEIINSLKIPIDFLKNDRFLLTMEFSFVDKKPRDLTNFAESQKYAIDGIFLALELDDSQIDKVVLLRGIVNKQDPHVILTLERLKNAKI